MKYNYDPMPPAYDYEVTVGPPALPPPEPELVAAAPTNHRRRWLWVALIGAVNLIVAILVTMMWLNEPTNNVGAPDIPAPTTETLETPAPPVTKWVVPDLPDAQPALGVDARYVAILARHGVGPGPGKTDQQMADNAHQMCDALTAGLITVAELQVGLSTPSNQITPEQARMIVTTTIDLYCPANRNH
jgi:Protein of unknown function (DUF732)